MGEKSAERRSVERIDGTAAYRDTATETAGDNERVAKSPRFGTATSSAAACDNGAAGTAAARRNGTVNEVGDQWNVNSKRI